MKRLASILVFSCLAFNGCARYAEVYAVSFLSKSGDELASGTISLKDPLPVVGKTRGKYRLDLRPVASTQKEIVWFYRLFEGKKEGEVEWTTSLPSTDEAPQRFDFMPGKADANVFADAGPSEGGVSKGTWTYSIAAGGWEGGSFVLSKK